MRVLTLSQEYMEAESIGNYEEMGEILAEIDKRKMPRTTLSNGLVVGNFSSPHPFNFEDGSVVEKCGEERVREGMLKAEEVVSEGVKGTQDIELTFCLTEAVLHYLEKAQKSEADIVLVPLPLMVTVKNNGLFEKFNKIRVVRVSDRISKKIHIDKFCI